MNRLKLKRISIIGLAVSAAIWIALSFALSGVHVFGLYIGEIFAMVLGGVPAMFLQLRLCLTDREKWVRWVPAAVTVLVYAAALICYIEGSFSGTLLALLIVILGMAPAAGICLGWLAHGKKPALIPLNLLLIFYLALNEIPLVSRPIDLTDVFVAIYFLTGIYFFIKPVERGGEDEPEN